ncbi:MAG: PspA/IM30 family protein [Candidatus Hydrogenedentes bacterium]|nr:PspA/IM30 family protein [Candidatus Hydrogenedentota bacterium]MBI3118608.1 PspA/IM30 family protein [Candidatus Hydrogenedentota bacterium]
MIGKFFKAFMAQVNKLANFFWQADPIAQMQLEYDNAVEQLKEGRQGLEQYRALVERVTRQVRKDESRVTDLSAKIKSYLKVDDRATAGKFALELKRAQDDLEENKAQLDLHEKSYQNNLTKIQHAGRKLHDVQTKIQKYDAELKMSAAEAEMAHLAQSFDFDVTTDFGQLENVIQQKIDLNRARVRVASDLSGQGIAEIQAEQRMEEAKAEDLLRQFEVDMGLRTPETANVGQQEKSLGQAEAAAEEKERALKEVEKQLGT